MSDENEDPFGAPVAEGETAPEEDPFGAHAENDGDAPAEEDPFGAHADDGDAGDDEEGEEVVAVGYGDEEQEEGGGGEEDAQPYQGDALPEGFDPYASDEDEAPPPGSLGAMLRRGNEGDEEQHDHDGYDDHGNGDEEEEEVAHGYGDDEDGQGGNGFGNGFGDAEAVEENEDDVDDDGYRAGFRGFGDDAAGDEFGFLGEVLDEEEGSGSVDESVESMKAFDEEAFADDDAADVEEPDDDDAEPEKTYPEWDAAPLKLKLFSILEPSVTEFMEQPTMPWAVSVCYHSFYLVVLLANGFANVAGTYTDHPFGEEPLDAIKRLAAGMFIFDLVTRAPLMTSRRYVPALFLDALTSMAEVLLLTVGDMGINEINYIPPLRSTRVFLFVGLFVRTETFRDINLAIRTVVSSLRPLMVFIVLVVIGLLMFSTFVYLTERGEWDSARQQWYRECHPFLSVCQGVELSPFQSIPDSMWLIIQSMTTVGYGDVTPTSTTGRFVTGCAIISGVFVIAFPAMVLIGNLDQSRRDFFAQQERQELEHEYREKAKELDELENQEAATTASRTLGANTTGHEQSDSSDDDENENRLEFVPTSRAMIFGRQDQAASAPDAGDFGAVSLMAKSRADFACADGATTFSFMGDDAREVTRHPRGYWLYDPIFQLLADPEDGLPLLSNVIPNPGVEGSFLGSVTLILDDPEAQALASEEAEKLDPDAPEPMAHAAPVFALDVTFKRPVPNVRLRRRVTTGAVHDHTVPITLEIVQTESGSVQEFLESTRRALNKGQLVIKYNKQPVTSATWFKNVPITSVMLSTTPFIQDLRAIAVNIAPREFWTLAERTEANEYARTRRNIAYITQRHLTALVYPIFRKVTTSSYVLRNITIFIDTVANMIKLHCREVLKHDVPEPLRPCIYMGDQIADFERLFEVDVDYFRTIDWPLGTVTCEFSERMQKTEITVRIADSSKGEQPVIADMEALRRDNVNDGAFDAEEDVDVFGADF